VEIAGGLVVAVEAAGAGRETVTGERGARLGLEENTATRLRQLLTLPGGREEEEGAGAGMTAGIENRGMR